MAKSPRMPWLDWQRGLAVLFMIEVHLVNGWSRAVPVPGLGRMALKYLGGLAAPGFLYMAGLALVLADTALERKGVPARARRVQHLRRALWLLGVAYVFRLVELFTGGGWRLPGGWLAVLRPDVLNVIAVSLALTTLVIVGLSGWRRVAAAAIAATVVIVATPALSSPELAGALGGYVHALPGSGFGLFNWAAFTLAGACVGALVTAGVGPARLLALAAVLALSGVAGFWLPGIAAADFFGTSPAWFLLRLGLTVAISGALMLLPAALTGLGWLTRLGRHSLAAYVVSVELTYGFWFRPLHGGSSAGLVAVAILAMTAAMVGLAYGLDRRGLRRAPGPAGAEPAG
jgi:uncharacterized membrane protein